MKALVCHQWCDFNDLAIEDFPDPPLTPEGVRIGIHYASVSFATTLWVAGKYQRKPPLPFVPGTEVAGVVLECGSKVTRCKSGDRVVALLDWGGFAQQVVCPDITVYRAPDGLELHRAIYLPNSYGTASAALRWRAKLAAGETLLVHAAAGAVGLAAVEIGKVLGATVIATASTEEKLQVAKHHGADFALLSRAEDLPRRVKERTGGHGADVIFDPVGGDLFDASLRCINIEGRLLTIGYAGGRIPSAPANLLLVKNASAMGFNYGTYLGWGLTDERLRYAAKVQQNVADLFDWCQAGKLHPRISHVFPFQQYREAMATVVERRALGKVILNIAGTEAVRLEAAA